MAKVQQKSPSRNGDAAEPTGEADTSVDPQALRSAATVEEVDDPFNPESLRLNPAEIATLGTKQAILECPARKPDKSWWVRVHPSEDYSIATAVLELKEAGELYLLAPHLRDKLVTEPTYRMKLFRTAITRQGKLFLWDLNLPGADGKQPGWLTVPLDAAKMAEKEWVRIAWSQDTKGFIVKTLATEVSDPEWPELPFGKLLRLAFKDSFVKDLDHPILKKLRGEV